MDGQRLVRLRGLPFNVSVAEIEEFFEPMIPHRVDLGCGARGEAYVLFGCAKDASLALSYDYNNIGNRYIEVFAPAQEDAIRHLALIHAMETDGVLRLRGLPFSITKEEIAVFLKDWDITPEDVAIGFHTTGSFRGKPTGEAFVLFPDSLAAMDAMFQKHQSTIGDRYVEMYLSTSAHYVHAQKGAGCLVSGPRLRLRGLPFDCDAQHLVDFFAEYTAISPDRIQFVPGPGPFRPSGEAYVSFLSEDEATWIKEKLNNHTMGERYIEIFVEPGVRRRASSTTSDESCWSPSSVSTASTASAWPKLDEAPKCRRKARKPKLVA